MTRLNILKLFLVASLPIGIFLTKGHATVHEQNVALQVLPDNSPYTVAANMTFLPGIRPDLFDPPVAPNALAIFKTPPIIVKPVCTVLGPPNIQVDPMSGYVYKGMVDLDGTEYALLENPTTGEGYFSKVGDSIDGADVVGISKDWMRYTTPSGERQIAMNKNYSLVPLSKGGTSVSEIAMPMGLIPPDGEQIVELPYLHTTTLTLRVALSTQLTEEQAQDLQIRYSTEK